MIRIVQKDGRNCPRFICDVCDEPLEGRDCMVRWKYKEPNKYQHVHKIKCDHPPDNREWTHWEDLDVHMVYLRDNLKLTKAQWKNAEKRADLLECI